MNVRTKHIEHKVYIAIVGLVFAALTVIFLFFPRPAISGLERRSLAKFPQWEKLIENPQQFTSDVSHWFSDTEPFREKFLFSNMRLRNALKLNSYIYKYTGSIPISFKVNSSNAYSAGIIVSGTEDSVRALRLFNAPNMASDPMIKLFNEYADSLPNVQVYTLIAPRSSEFYTPQKIGNKFLSQKGMLNYIHDNLSSKVKYVDVFNVLSQHTNENIYLRSDHHWSPLGAYYAAKEFAKIAGVPFRNLDSYQPHVHEDFVGSMFGVTKDISFWNKPEEFVYYTPKDSGYITSYIAYSHYNNDGESFFKRVSEPKKGDFFTKMDRFTRYSTFMGGDYFLVKVQTETPSPRRLLIIKDSYGNPIPGYLFQAFNQIHVIDYRNFDMNLKEYVDNNEITDLLMVFNIFTVCSDANAKMLHTFLEQESVENGGW